MHVQDLSSTSHREKLGFLKDEQRHPKASMVAISASFLRVRQAGFSIADQALFVGGTFLANVMLARTQTKEEYGMFVLSYSVFTFLTGLHNASILEPYTVYGSGRYCNRVSEYLRLMARSNAIVGLVLTGSLLLVCLFFSWFAPHLFSRSLLGLGLTVGILLSGIFLRRAFYLEGKAMLAAGVSLAYFVTVALVLWFAARAHFLDGFSVFLILALGWIVAGAVFARRLPFGKTQNTFLDFEPKYWNEHWKYARWVLVTAFVFQFTTQGYYWLVAEFLSVREVAELRAMYLLIGPLDQLFIALSYLLLPMLALHYASKRMDKLVYLWEKYLLATVGAAVFFALAVRTLGKPVMHILYAGKFDGLAPLLFLLALLPLLMGIGNTLSNVLNAMEKPKLVFWGYVCSGVATFLLGIPLVLHFGLRGAVYGMLVSGTTYTAALGIAFLFAGNKSFRQEATPAPPSRVSPMASGVAPVSEPSSFRHGKQPTKIAPIAMFVYNRPEHTEQAIKALRGNDLASKSDLFIFADGAKSDARREAVREVRLMTRGINGFKSITMVERERNFGLSKSIIGGVTQLCEEYGRAIAIEDDVMTAPDFLTFLNYALDRYEGEPEIFSVSGFNYPMVAPPTYPYDVFFSPRSACWGWATWRDRWNRADWSIGDFREFIADREQRKRFNRGGDDLTWLLTRQVAGRVDSWDIVWAYTHFRQNGVAMFPVVSKAYNIGLDGSGVHCRRAPFSQVPLNSRADSCYRFPDTVQLDPYFVGEIHRLHRRPVAKKIARYLLDSFGFK